MEQQIKEFETLTELLDDLELEKITGYQRRKIVDRYMMRKSRIHGRPYCASFELTPLCNFNCKMCYMHLTEKQMIKSGRLLSTAEWLDIIKQAVDAGVMSVDLTGGECLTYPGFREIYTYLVSRGVRVAVLTNGQLVTDEWIDFFRHIPPSMIQISLYGSSPEAYEHVTGKKAFNDVMAAIKRIQKASLPCTVTMTPNRFMQNDTTALMELLHKLGVKYEIAFGTLTARPETEREIADYIVDNAVYSEIKRLEMLYQQQQMEKKETFDIPKPYNFRIKGEENFSGLPCYAGSAFFHVNWKGEMTPCVPFYSVTQSVLGGRLLEAWKQINQAVLTYRLPDECSTCKHGGSCSACPAERTQGILNGSVNPFVCKRCKELNSLELMCNEER